MMYIPDDATAEEVTEMAQEQREQAAESAEACTDDGMSEDEFDVALAVLVALYYGPETVAQAMQSVARR